MYLACLNRITIQTMKKFLHSFWILSCILCIVFYSPQIAHSNVAGAPAGNTGSPGDGGNTCAGCHGGGAETEFDVFEIIPTSFPEEYIAGEVYSFEVDIFTPGTSSNYGFELIAEDDFGNSIGEIVITDSDNTQLIGGGSYITHTSEGTQGDVGAFWGFDWQAPEDFEGNVTFYAAGNIANGNGVQGGDVIMTANLPIEIVSGTMVDVFGCTDPFAENYNAEATMDDESCVYGDCITIAIDVTVGTFPNEQEWEILDSDENIIWFGSGEAIYEENCMPYGAYTFNAHDSYGDGWNGGTYEVSMVCDGNYIVIANNNGESPTNGIFGSNSPQLETSELFLVEECTPCLGFIIDVETTHESSPGASDAFAVLHTNYGNEPFEITWSNGATGDTVFNLTEGFYSVSVTDAEDCYREEQFEILLEPDTFITGSGTLTNIETCNGVFYDTGGPDGWYEGGESKIIRICPEDENLFTQLVFTQFDIETWFGDSFTIYDGMGTSSPVLYTAGGFNLGEEIIASMENSSGCLTIEFESGSFSGDIGWEAFITCHDYVFLGCMDTEALNYDEQAEEDDGSCYYVPGCTDNAFVEYYTQVEELGIDTTLVDYDDGSCVTPYIDDCMSEEALNYNPEATHNEGEDPCIYQLDEWECGMQYIDARDGYSYRTILIGEQCWMAENLRYIPDGVDTVQVDVGGEASQFDDGFIYTGSDDDEYSVENNGRYYSYYSAEAAIPYYWHLPTRNEFQELIANNNGLDLQVVGDNEFNTELAGVVTVEGEEVNFSNGGNTTWMWTSTEESLNNAWVVSIVQDDENIQILPMPKVFGISVRAVFGLPHGAIEGCTDEDYVEFDPLANYDDGSCEIVAIEGCTDVTAINYYEIATVDDGSCIATVEGCMDDAYAEFNENANVDDGSCLTEAIFGCTEITAQNYDENANVDDGSCIAHILGCTDDAYAEYNPEATIDNGTCQIIAIFGCMDPEAFNYNAIANVDDESCVPFIEGCTDSNYIEFNGQANVDDNSCVTAVVLGCTIDYALNYNSLANTDDGTCQVEGCTDSLFVEYDANANINDGSCSVIAIWGCTNDLYIEYFPPANMDDGSCENLIVMGCTDPLYIEYSGSANVDDGSCENLTVIGCTNPDYIEYDPEAVVDNNSCQTPIVYGCTDSLYLEYNVSANVEDESCITLIVLGCTDSSFIEYNPLANVDDESCTYIALEGCTDSLFVEYNANANVDNGTCITPVILGCIDVLAFNYNPFANTDDGSCIPVVVGCMDINYVEYDSLANTSDQSLCITDAIWGCNDPEAINYDPETNSDDGSCFYYFVEITYVELANGQVEFTPIILGMGDDFQAYWDFGDGLASGQTFPIHTYMSNGVFEVQLIVNNGDVEVITSIEIDVINAYVSIDELGRDKQIVEIQYFDLMGRVVRKQDLTTYQMHIQKVIYEDATFKFVKSISAE